VESDAHGNHRGQCHSLSGFASPNDHLLAANHIQQQKCPYDPDAYNSRALERSAQFSSDLQGFRSRVNT
jgi:hypothetical protein